MMIGTVFMRNCARGAGCALLVVSFGCGPQQPAYGVELSLSGAVTPIVGVSYDDYFTQTIDGACRVTSTTSGDLSIAAPVGSTATLDIAVEGCGTAGTLPKMSCSWEATPRGACSPTGRATGVASGQVEWSGADHEASLTLPARTGLYDLTLSCKVDGGADLFEPLRSTLYVTYREPLFMALPAQSSHYERAATWGCGFPRETSEAEVLKQMLNNQFEYGRENWRYGSFDPPPNPQHKSLWIPYNEGTKEVPWYSCPWQALVEGDNPCNFADCYEFSQVFERVAATMGIGVFEPIADVGENSRGFTTFPGASALDPKFAGNVDCSANGCSGYLFSSHSLRLRDDLYYDATFNGVYESANQFISDNVDGYNTSGSAALITSKVRLRDLGRGYGFWKNWETAPGEAVSLTLPSASAESRSAVSMTEPNLTHTQLGLVVSTAVKIDDDGTYRVRAAVAHVDEHAKGAASTGWIPSSRRGSPVFAEATLQGPTEQTLSFPFGYEGIQSAGGAGDYVSRVIVTKVADSQGDVRAPAASASVEGRFTITENQLSAARASAGISDIEVVQVNLPTGAGQPGSFVARFKLSALEEGRYTVQARLSTLDSKSSLSYGGAEQQASAGDSTLDVVVPLPTLGDLSTPQTLTLTAQLLKDRDAHWYEDSIGFRRFTLSVSQSGIELIDGGS